MIGKVDFYLPLLSRSTNVLSASRAHVLRLRDLQIDPIS